MTSQVLSLAGLSHDEQDVVHDRRFGRRRVSAPPSPIWGLVVTFRLPLGPET
jgi:hypothetical protein